jgi:hypothetical protein
MHIRFLTAATLLAAGCSSGGGPSYVPVTGQLTLGGKPMANAKVTFQPIGSAENPNPGAGSYGKTDGDGRFSLMVVGKDVRGAVAGKHHVEVTTDDAGAAPIDPNFPDAPQPARRAAPRTYTLEVDVPPEGLKDKLIELPPK